MDERSLKAAAVEAWNEWGHRRPRSWRSFLFCALLREIFSTDRATHAKFSRWRTVRRSEIDISIWWIGS